jgi:hypothetical protein
MYFAILKILHDLKFPFPLAGLVGVLQTPWPYCLSYASKFTLLWVEAELITCVHLLIWWY